MPVNASRGGQLPTMESYMTTTHLAEMESVYKSFGETKALDGFSMEVRSGELVALLGENGAGKTTAIQLMLGLLHPDAGQIRLFGMPPGTMEARRQMGVMMQEVFLAHELKVHELLTVFCSYYPDGYDPKELMEFVNITSLRDRRYGQLSGGQKRQVQFAIALCGRPRLLFLDEPTVGLDVQARQALWDKVRLLLKSGCSILLTTHYLEEAEALADRIVVLAKGRVVSSGTVKEVTRLISTRKITCTTTLSAEDVATWPGVSAASVVNGSLELTVSHAELETVTRRLLAEDSTLADLEVSQAGLADAFIKITQESRQ
jgi:ABC-2 type transport system ATP-binding protein